MSDENVPKLRLKPKLVTEPAVAQPTPAKADEPPVEPAPSAPPAAEAEAPKMGRLKPKLTVAPAQEAAPAPTPEPVVEAAPVPEAPPAAPAAKAGVKFALKPKAVAAPQPTAADPSGPAPQPAVEPPGPMSPAVPATSVTASNEPVIPPEPAVASKPPGMAFPPPPGAAKGGKFPPPQGVKKPLPQAAAEVSAAPKAKTKFRLPSKKIMLMAGAGLAVLVLFGGGFIVYQKLTAVPPPQPKPKLATKPVTPSTEAVTPAGAAVDQTKAASAVPPTGGTATDAAGAEVKTAGPTPAEPAVVMTPEVKAPVEIKPAAPPPPPTPSVAFRGWVENLKIRGVRGGANPRVFIGASSYQKGDLVNPQMGITFEGYSDDTRLLVFKDKSGAKVERRN